MNWSLLWFVFAGIILGFALSTLWEWLYFRPKRMIVRDERIAELELALHDYIDRDEDSVAPALFNDGAARLETEEPENLVALVEPGEVLTNASASHGPTSNDIVVDRQPQTAQDNHSVQNSADGMASANVAVQEADDDRA